MLQNPSNLYSGGNVVLDATPYVRVALQQRARKQALNDALYQHYSELPNKLNTAGVRVQDLDSPYGGINDTLQGIRDYWMENKDKIVKGMPEQQKYQAMIQGASQQIGQSKQTGQMQVKSGQDFFTGKHQYKERDLAIKHAMDQSIFDPAHYKNPDIKQPYDLTDFSVYSPPYTSQKQAQFDNAVLKGITPKKNENIQPVYDEKTNKLTYTHTYDPNDIKIAADRAAQLAKSDLSISDHYEEMLNDEDKVKTASEALSKLLGKNVVIDTPEEMAAGLKANEMSLFTKPISETNQKAIWDWKEKQAALAEANRRERQRRSEKGKNARVAALMGDENVDYPLNVLVENYGAKHEIKSAEGQPFGTITRVKESDIPIGQLDLYNKKNIVRGFESGRAVNPIVDPDTKEPYYNAVQNPDGNWELVGEGGKKIGADDVREMKINKTIPANKEKRKMFFNKPTPKKDPLGIF